MGKLKLSLLATALVLCTACSQTAPVTQNAGTENLLVLSDQGSFFIGGSVKQAKGSYDHQQPLKSQGQTLHGDHAYVTYQIPAQHREFPLVFLHGAGQSAKTWESTPDGRDGGMAPAVTIF